MARQYPRFLFSESNNTKSAGYFIMHTLEPRVLASVQKINDSWQIVPLKGETLSSVLLLDMQMWLVAQIKLGTLGIK